MNFEEYYSIQEKEAGEFYGGWADQMVSALIQEVQQLNKNSYIIDIGCNSGRSIYELNKLGFYNSIGVDLISSKIIQARSNNCSSLVMNMENLFLFNDQAFDYGFMSHTIEHSLNPVKAINEMLRICKKGLIICPIEERETDEKTPHYSKFFNQEQWINTWNKNCFSKKADHELKKRFGFEVWTKF